MGQEGEIYLEGGMLMRQEAWYRGLMGQEGKINFWDGGGLLMGQDG
jgi:hypothetical protein